MVVLRIVCFIEKMLLKKSLTSKKPFEKGQTDRFELENIEFKEIDKIMWVYKQTSARATGEHHFWRSRRVK